MKTILTILLLCGVCFGYAQNTPPHAASTKTWKFGSQTWSDAIEMPGCNKKTIGESATEPRCLNSTEGSNTWFYYNWVYVNANAKMMCPAPWRVPTYDDLVRLIDLPAPRNLMFLWNAGGMVIDDYLACPACFYTQWSITPADGKQAIYFGADESGTELMPAQREHYLQVRCVK
jgi:hypothetical protein